ncbi:uncharacterized protein [Branchiostoma lanceolatum]|uniref:uncharacterized protein n=1 Tax=Branchiostoma lanceolatum TaxID=7740 RepID=UPI0034544552
MAVKMRNRQVLIWAFLSIVVLVNDVMPLAGNALETIRERVAEGESVVLDCDLEYDPNKQLYWVQDLGGTGLIVILQRFANSSPEHVELHHPYRNRTDITLEGPEGTSLRIGSVRKSDNATDGRYYECQQPQGDKRKSRYELHVTYRPDPPTDIGIRGVRLYSFNISCTASDGGGLSQKLCLKHHGKNLSIICKEDIDQGEEVQFSVGGLNYSTPYQLCVYAENQLGSSGCGKSSVVMVTTEAIGQFYAELRFLNVPFTSPDPNDQRNRELVYRLNKTLIGLLQPSHPDLTVEVTKIRQGSVIVTVRFKGVQKEMENIKGTLKQAVTGGDLAHLGVDPHYFHTFAHRKAETSTPVLIPILVAVVIIVLLTAGGLVLYWKLKKRATEVTNVPEPTTYFESEDFKRLSQQLEHSNICIVHGQLGIGKSQAVMNLVKQFQAKTKSYVTWFIGNTNNFSDTITNEDTGLSQKTVLEKLLEFVEELKESGRPVNIKQGEKDIAKICEAVKASKNKCLLVFDDVQDISVIPRQLLTPWPELTILITTMDETLGLHSDYPEIPRLKMKGFSQTDVVSFLTSGSEDNVLKQTDQTVLRELAHQFAFLPLGLSLAKSHILGSGTSVQEYLRHLHQQKQAMGRGNKNLSEPERNIFAAVQLLLTHRMDEASRQVLQLMAFLMPNNIPTGIISEAYWHLSRRELNIDEFIKAVRKLSLGQVTVEKKTAMRVLTIHQLTQRAVLDMLSDKEQDEMICALVKAFLVLFTKDTREIRVGLFVSQLYPHLLSLLGHPTLSLENLLSVENSEHLLTALIRLNEVLCYLYCQQRHADRAMDAADKAKRLCNHICKDLPSEHISEVYGKLKREGLDRFQNDVYGKTVTHQLLTLTF